MNLQYLINILREEGIARRFFVMNSFDGVLTVLGVITAMYLSGESDSRIILLSCFAPAVALMISGIWSAYAIEKAERALELRRLEGQMLVDLGETAIGK
ncbi:MAG: hypothetical protein KAU03_02180, partial [Candidatus Altiarchaeales archaeon]|nr:hypothetical protein [Candidatus Altiarchaeales archaeon]